MTTQAVSESSVLRSSEPIGGGRLGIILAVVASVLAIAGARAVQWQDVDGYGLISALPPVYWLAVVIGLAATVILLRAAQDTRSRYGGGVSMMWLVILHTATQLAHEHVRFSIVWTHIGFVRVIEETGAGRVDLDARFAWPGFFGAFVAPLGQMPMPLLELVMRLWPTYITGGTAILVAALARRAYPTVPLIGSLSSLGYVVLAWTGQDYFSPQSVGYLFYIAILVIVESGPLRTSPAWSSTVPFLARFAAAGGDRPAARSTPAFVALVILSFGAVVSHPLAPFFICMAMVILALYGRSVAWRLLAFVGMAYFIWFLVAAEPWWSSRLEELLGNMGQPWAIFSEGTEARVSRSDEFHRFVAQVRSMIGLGTFGAVLAIGVSMATERYRHLRPAIPLAPLAGIPAMAVALQTYGGEIIIRVLLFTLPMAAILIGRFLAALHPKLMPYLATLAVGLLIPVFLVARFGNEEFEMAVGTDRDAVEAAYEEARAFNPKDNDTLFVADNGFVNWRDQGIGRNYFKETIREAHLEKWDECRLQIYEHLRQDEGLSQVLAVFTNTQRAWMDHGYSLPPNHMDDVVAGLKSREGTRVIYENDGAWVLEIDTTNTAELECPENS